ncbi:MAG: crotonase/enoyl-CoA hydratase family protein [Pseudomonadota bacterium]
MYKTLLLERDARGVATLTLNRPEKRNALSAEMIAELTQAAAQLAADPSVRVVVLTGAGQSFCAGGDLGWMRDQMGMDPDTRKAEAQKLAEMLGALNTLPKPLIGKIQGNAFGGGVGLACICDVAIGVEGVKFGLTETRLGLIPATIGPYVLARMGEGRARQVFMSSRLFEAQEAERLGILSKSVSRDALEAAVAEEIAAYLACAPGAVADAKALALRLGASIPQSSIERSIDALAARWDDPEAEEGTAAFFEKRKADWMA